MKLPLLTSLLSSVLALAAIQAKADSSVEDYMGIYESSAECRELVYKKVQKFDRDVGSMANHYRNASGIVIVAPGSIASYQPTMLVVLKGYINSEFVFKSLSFKDNDISADGASHYKYETYVGEDSVSRSERTTTLYSFIIPHTTGESRSLQILNPQTLSYSGPIFKPNDKTNNCVMTRKGDQSLTAIAQALKDRKFADKEFRAYLARNFVTGSNELKNNIRACFRILNTDEKGNLIYKIDGSPIDDRWPMEIFFKAAADAGR